MWLTQQAARSRSDASSRVTAARRTLAAVATAVGLSLVVPLIGPAMQAEAAPSANPVASGVTSGATPPIDLRAFSTTDPTSLWVLVNKRYKLSPARYTPRDLVVVAIPKDGGAAQLRKEPARALKRLAAASNKATGKRLAIASGYRSHSSQVSLFASYSKRSGVRGAEQFSARAGHSEHQTGLAVDVSELGSGTRLRRAFGTTRSGKWIAKNAWRHGFIVRYPDGESATTGYIYEPWHLRYVGPAMAAHMHKNKIRTLEAALGKGAAPSYKRSAVIKGFGKQKLSARPGKSVSKKVRLSHAGTLERRRAGTWQTVKKLKPGRRTVKLAVPKGHRDVAYRIRIKTTSTRYGATSGRVTVTARSR